MHVCKEKVESDVKELEIPSFSEVGEETSRYAALTGVSYALLVSTAIPLKPH